MTTTHSNAQYTMRTFALALLTLLTLSSRPLLAGERDMILEPGERRQTLVGVFGGLNFNSHKGDYSIFDGNQPCCTFHDGSGTGAVFGLRAIIPFGQRWIFEPRLSYEGRGGLLKASVYQNQFRGANNQIETGNFQNELETSLPFINLDLMAGYVLWKRIGLSVNAGFSIGMGLSKNYDEFESYLGPSGVQYVKDNSTRTSLPSGQIQDFNSLQFGFRAGLLAAIPLTKRLYLCPEILYHLPINPVSAQASSAWKISILQPTLGLSLSL